MKAHKNMPDNQQAQRFAQAARELGCDDSEERFLETVRKIAKAPPQHKTAKKPGRTRATGK
jgi:hypothetical protein